MSGFRIMRVSREVVTEFLQGRCRPASCDLPEDAEVIGAVPQSIDYAPPHYVSFLLRSDEWEPTREGERYPEIVPEYTHLDEKS